ncbi:tRNA pseudouridine{38-40} synthase [Geoglobus ahangari]|uniref:tRNA pseudouridine synthase A n=1 Tax=Geoglobus ahangari TaxID=113653 RepID=A0A0F7IHY4_9EURY|nr:tRNA pseudouridine(38-40) synthase TruA [Geoglobus ahangari]AKG92368.1 tRNA pseudouridine{38-40} synthase [Geoglobus ahangari]
MLRVAFKLAYFGWNYHGSQYQPHVPTVDGELFRAFERMGINARERRYRTAGRTDAGVSALGNVFALDLDTFDPWMVRVLNSHLPEDITVWAYRVVDDDFDPRRNAVSRLYQYVMLDEGYDVETMDEAARMLVGKHDFSGFAKNCRPCVREIYVSKVEKDGELLIYTVEGNAFAWNMVRKIVTALKIAGREKSPEIVERVLSGEQIPLTPASPYGLILKDVRYSFDFEVEEKGLATLRERIAENFRKFAQLYGVFRILSDF